MPETLFDGVDIAKKVCTKCHRALPIEDFDFNPSKSGKNYRRGQCKHCRSERGVRYQSSARGKLVRRKNQLKRDYGVDVEQYESLAKAQGNVCAICRRPETKIHRDGKLYSLSVDHDHVTGKARSLLCQKCNLAIGNFDDDTERLRAAVAYLQKHGGAP